MIEAIKRGIQHCHTHNTLTASQPDQKDKQSQEPPKAHIVQDTGAGAGAIDGDHSSELRQLLSEHFDSATVAFDRFKDKDDTLSRKGFKAMVASLGMRISDQERE